MGASLASAGMIVRSLGRLGRVGRRLNFVVRRQMRLRLERVACVIATGLLCGGAFALPSEDPCHEAYWDGTKAQDLARCRRSAESGDADAESQYGLILWSGHGRASDHKAALDWLRKSARQGYMRAKISLGAFLSHEELEAELRNPVEAYAWFVTAGASKAAARVKDRLTQTQMVEAERVATEYRSKYAKH